MSKCIGCGSELTTGDINNLCNQCTGRPIINIPRIFGPAPGHFDPPPEYPPFETPNYGQSGWMCPRCGQVNAPWKPKCDCPPPSITTTDTQLKISF